MTGHSATPATESQPASIAIIGGGPAGGFSALELAKAGCEVVLLESRPAVAWKIGETLPPEVRLHLTRLGYWDQFQTQKHLTCPGVVSVWGAAAAIEKDFIFHPYGHGWQLDRTLFESELLDAVAVAGGRVCMGVVIKELEHTPSGWSIRISDGNIDNTLRADWILDCTGRRGAVIGSEGGDYEQLDSMVSVFAIAETSQATDRDARTYVEALSEGWCYSALMPDGKRVVAYQTDRDLLGHERPNASWLGSRIAAGSEIVRLLKAHDYHFDSDPTVMSAHSGRFRHCAGKDWIAVGDAAMTFDPISGQGTAKTLESSHLAARAILHDEDYQAACDNMWTHYLSQRHSCYLAEQRFPGSSFWSRRQYR